MAPQPKRKHSTQRKGKRIATRRLNFNQLINCPNCHKKKLPHRECLSCKK